MQALVARPDGLVRPAIMQSVDTNFRFNWMPPVHAYFRIGAETPHRQRKQAWRTKWMCEPKQLGDVRGGFVGDDGSGGGVLVH